MQRRYILILLTGILSGTVSWGCDFMGRLKPNYKAIVTKLNFYKEDGTLQNSLDCQSGQLRLDYSSDRFTLQEFRAECDSGDVVIHTTASTLHFDKAGAHYTDLNGRAIAIKTQCNEEQLRFRHIHQGTWVDGLWTRGDNTWSFKFVGKSLLFHWVREYPGGRMETVSQLK